MIKTHKISLRDGHFAQVGKPFLCKCPPLRLCVKFNHNYLTGHDMIPIFRKNVLNIKKRTAKDAKNAKEQRDN